MDIKQFVMMSKDIIEKYLEHKGDTETLNKLQELDIVLMDSSIVMNNRKGMFFIEDIGNILYEVTIDYNNQKAYLAVYQGIDGLEFDFTINQPEEQTVSQTEPQEVVVDTEEIPVEKVEAELDQNLQK